MLERARERGGRPWAFCGPLLPGLSATAENVEPLFVRLARLDLDSIIVDKLNFRSGVFESLMGMLHRFYPELIPYYYSLRGDLQEYECYVSKLRLTVREIARSVGLESRIDVAFE